MKERELLPNYIISAGALRQLNRTCLSSSAKYINSTYYASDDVYLLLRAYSVNKAVLQANESGKCYYCESKTEYSSKLQVEHYRPKAMVDKLDHDGINTLPGYYWLALEWSNLLLSCSNCNKRDAKGFRFPILGQRAMPINPVTLPNHLDRSQCLASGNPLLLELPVLLNPEIDHPEEFLRFDDKGVLVSHGANAFRADQTITILKLNRDLLL